MLLVLHAPPQPGDDSRAAKIFWRDPEGKWLPSGLRHDELALGELLNDYKQALDEIDLAEDVANTARDYFDVLRRLNPLSRTLTNLYNVLQDARQACKDAPELIHARDTAYGLQRRAELMQKEAQHALDFEGSPARPSCRRRNAHRMAVSAHRLNLLVAFLLSAGDDRGHLRHELPPWSRTVG